MLNIFKYQYSYIGYIVVVYGMVKKVWPVLVHTQAERRVDCWTSQVNQSVQTYTVSWQRHSVCFHVLITCKVTPSNIEI